MNLFVFDFDKTITVSDTILPISRYLSEWFNQKYKFRIIQFYFLLFRLNVISGKSFKEMITATLLAGKEYDLIENVITQFYNAHSSELFNKEIIQLIKSEKEKGNKIIIITSNLNLFVNPVKNTFPVDDIFATTIEVKENKIGNYIKGKNCTGNVKAEILQQYKTLNNFEKITAYGDSTGDFEMLLKADEGFIAEYIFTNRFEKIKYRLKNLNGRVPVNSKIVFNNFSEKYSFEV
ncbi:HAD-IB family phosphatase [Ignavibacterium sp.]|uniref:HAD family hydrolase n=1 Tax=Ignavibacterium sp. TaxID=2651167 RepID=UPI00307DA5BE